MSNITYLKAQADTTRKTVRATESWGFDEDIQLWTPHEDQPEATEELSAELVFAQSLVALVAEHGPQIGASLGMLEAKMLGLDISLEVLQSAIEGIYEDEEEGEGDNLIGCEVADLLTQLSEEQDDLLF